MANNKKKTAAEEAAAQQAAPAGKKITDSTILPEDKRGLSQEAKVQFIGQCQTERAFMMNNGEAEKIPQFVKGISLMAQAFILDVGINEIACGTSAAGRILVANPENYQMFKELGVQLGVNLPDFKALPAATEEDLKAAGLAGLLPGAKAEIKTVVIDKKNVSKEAIDKKKAEIRETEKAVENPADVKNEGQLKASLIALLAKPVSKELMNKHDPRIQRTISFYNSYLTIKANAAENKEEALKKIKEMSRIQLLTEISDIIGPCPFAMGGIAKFLVNRANETGYPVSPFCTYRRCATAPDSQHDDQYLADIVRTLVVWSCKSQIAEFESMIKTKEAHVKNEKGAAKAATEAAIRHNQESIENLKKVISEISNPSLDVVDNLIENYKLEDKDDLNYKLAHRIVDDVMKTYYPDLDREKLDQDVMLANVQQHAGVIINMFRDPLTQSIAYSTSNIVEMVEKKEEKKDEKPAEEEGKN